MAKTKVNDGNIMAWATIEDVKDKYDSIVLIASKRALKESSVKRLKKGSVILSEQEMRRVLLEYNASEGMRKTIEELRKVNQQYQEVNNELNAKIEKLEAELKEAIRDEEQADRAMHAWKAKYEMLLGEPKAKYTTKSVMKADEELLLLFDEIDKEIHFPYDYKSKILKIVHSIESRESQEIAELKGIIHAVNKITS